MIAIVKRLHDDLRRACGFGADLLGFVRVGGKGLLAQHVFSRSQRLDRPLGVQAVGKRIVDCIDVGIGKQLVIAGRNARNMMLGGELLCARRVPGSDGHDFDVVDPLCRCDQRHRRDARSTQRPYAQGLWHASSLNPARRLWLCGPTFARPLRSR